MMMPPPPADDEFLRELDGLINQVVIRASQRDKGDPETAEYFAARTALRDFVLANRGQGRGFKQIGYTYKFNNSGALEHQYFSFDRVIDQKWLATCTNVEAVPVYVADHSGDADMVQGASQTTRIKQALETLKAMTPEDVDKLVSDAKESWAYKAMEAYDNSTPAVPVAEPVKYKQWWDYDKVTTSPSPVAGAAVGEWQKELRRLLGVLDDRLYRLGSKTDLDLMTGADNAKQAIVDYVSALLAEVKP